MKRECILSDTELTKKRKIIQKNKIKKILNEQNEMTREETEVIEQGNRYLFIFYFHYFFSYFFSVFHFFIFLSFFAIACYLHTTRGQEFVNEL